MKWFRFTIRRIMVMVAIVALSIFAVQRCQKSRIDSQEKLNSHKFRAALYRALLEPQPTTWILRNPPSPVEQKLTLRLAEYHEVMILKYERAVDYPWFPVWADPPEPR